MTTPTIAELSEMYPDIPRIHQNDGTGSVVKISYTPEFSLGMDMFRGVLSTGEKSERVLTLLWCVLQLNPANYTVWKYRRDCLRAIIGTDVTKELTLVAALALRTPKNFQLWHHRRDVMLMDTAGTTPPCDERALCFKILSDDPKNYHVWSHRKWFVMQYGAYDGEMAYTDALLANDVYNNSAWNYRHFLMDRETDETEREAEIMNSVKMLQLAPENEAPLTYAESMCEINGVMVVRLVKVLYEEIIALRSTDEQRNTTVAVMWSLQELARALGLREEAARHVTVLKEIDPVRKVFWESMQV